MGNSHTVEPLVAETVAPENVNVFFDFCRIGTHRIYGVAELGRCAVKMIAPVLDLVLTPECYSVGVVGLETIYHVLQVIKGTVWFKC